MRTPGHTPALSGIDPDSLLQPSVQHREVRQEVSKLANISKTIKRKRDQTLIFSLKIKTSLLHLVDGDHEGVSELVDLGIQEDVGTGESVLLPEEGVYQLHQGGQGVKF